MHRPNGKQLGTFGIGACWLALGINGLRLARIAELEHTGVFLRLAWMSPLQAYIASSLLLALGIYSFCHLRRTAKNENRNQTQMASLTASSPDLRGSVCS